VTTGLAYHEAFLDHDPGLDHPECAERLSATQAHLKTLPWYSKLLPVDVAPAEREWIHHVHADKYVQHAETVCRSGAPYLDSMDVGVCDRSFDVALLAAGAPIAIADHIVAGTIDNGMALVRPPGHHAEHAMALGFCLFNNVAVLARWLQRQHGVDKVLILDWDVHHGNGTQHAFEEDPSVLYISTHQYPYYPGTGAAWETGNGRGQGATLNCPLPAGSTDRDYEHAFSERILPKIKAFRPEFIVISAGFDAHADDPLAQMRLSTGFYGWMTERLMEAAQQHCAGRIVSVLEGGYNLQALPLCVAEHLAVLSQNRELKT
jgi:acetoin utilization deacetylase AcuC-like enzyme